LCPNTFFGDQMFLDSFLAQSFAKELKRLCLCFKLVLSMNIIELFEELKIDKKQYSILLPADIIRTKKQVTVVPERYVAFKKNIWITKRLIIIFMSS
jgi:hypothetical protein